MQQTNTIPALSKTELNILKNNFQNIYGALHTAKKPSLELVPDLWGDGIYHTRAGWRGRILSFIHSIIEFFSGNDHFKKNRLQQLIKKTNETYHNLASQVAPHLHAYSQYIDEKCHCKHSQMENKIHNSRREIKRFYEATHNFSKLIKQAFIADTPKNMTAAKFLRHQKLCEKVKTFINSYFSDDLEKQTPDLAFYQESTYLETIRYIHIMALEGFSQGPLPFHKIKQASFYRKVNLKKWVRKLNERKNSLDIRVFNQGIKAIVDLQINSTLIKPSLENVQLALRDAQFSGFKLADAKHLKWRSSLKEGDEIILDSKKIILGEQLSRKLAKTDKHLVFEIKDASNQIDPAQVLVIGPNKARLKLRELIRKDVGWGMHTADVIYEDPKGKFFLVEKLEKPLKNLKWENNDCLSKKDQEIAESIKTLIEWFIKQNATPLNLSVNSLMFSASGELKSIKSCVKGEVNVMALETLAFECSKGNNLPVYHFLTDPILTNSTFIHYQQFFIDIIKNALKEDNQDVSKIAAQKNITDKIVIKRAKMLYTKIIGLKNKLHKKIDRKFRIIDVEKFNLFIDQAILKTYVESKTFGRLWPNFNSTYLYNFITKEDNDFLKKIN